MNPEESQFQGIGTKGRLPQEVPLWHADYMGLKSIKAQNTQEDTWSLPSTPQLHKKDLDGGAAPEGALPP